MEKREEEEIFADIIVPLPLREIFTYIVPSEIESEIKVGCRVVVPFGPRKLYSGVVKRIHRDKPENRKIKPIKYLLDTTPIVSTTQIRFWEWISTYYLCSEGEVMKAALPGGLKIESETRVRLTEQYRETLLNANEPEKEEEKLEEGEAGEPNLKAFKPREQEILNLLSKKKSMAIKEINKQLSTTHTLSYISNLITIGAVSTEENIQNKRKLKRRVTISLSPNIKTPNAFLAIEKELSRAQKQRQLFQLFINLAKEELERQDPERQGIENIEIDQERLKVEGITRTHIKTLIDKEIFIQHEEFVANSRDLDAIVGENSRDSDITPKHTLSNAQATAYSEIVDSFKEKSTTLLHGVTSSGKTEIYINLIHSMLERGEQALFLMPEIALTSQMIRRLKKSFGNKVDIYHSKIGDKERIDLWNKVRNFSGDSPNQGEYQIVLGARSAMFLPFNNLKLIIVDEEHETSFKQHAPAPRYSARDCSLVLSNLFGGKTLLGSATPSIETYYNAKQGKYGLVSLTTRHGDVALPTIEIADSKEGFRKKIMKRHFTPELYSAIEENLADNKQAILFQNRRGYSAAMFCKGCSWMPKCTKCDVSLTQHKGDNRLRCHYCGHAEYIPTSCPKCGDRGIRGQGLGTEKVEDDVKELFPDCSIGRMDLDTTKSKDGHQKIIEQLESGEIDILTGTQMITKGLDFERVTVVGVLNADTLLNFPDFRSYERSFQMLTQVSGRAGRRSLQGRVIIQTFTPKHPVLQHVISGNYKALYNEEIREREIHNYPPFCRLVSIMIKHPYQSQLDNIAKSLATILKKQFLLDTLGPEYPLVKRVQNLYCKQIWVKLKQDGSFNSSKQNILKSVEYVRSLKVASKTTITIDIDPM